MLVDLHGKIKALFFFSPFNLFYGMTNGIFVSLFNFVSLFMLTASYLYKTQNSCTLVHLQILCFIFI